jgi:hypothetical protein
VEFAGESAAATVAVVTVGQVLPEDADFDETASAVADSAECPVLVVRSSAVRVAIRPGRQTTREA